MIKRIPLAIPPSWVSYLERMGLDREFDWRLSFRKEDGHWYIYLLGKRYKKEN